MQDAVRQGAKVLVAYNDHRRVGREKYSSARRRKVLEYIRPWVDLYKVDLRELRQPPLPRAGKTSGPFSKLVRALYDMGVWLEIVTLLIPRFNDSEDELKGLSRFSSRHLARYSLACDCVLHKDYKMDDPDNTRPADLFARR